VRRRPQQYLALDQRLADQPELVVLEVAQAAVNQLAAARGGALREVVLLAQQHLEPAPRGVARDARTVDATADDDKVEQVHEPPRAQAFFFFFLGALPLFSLAGALLGRGP
jgi:hypothetical protein